MLLKKVQIFFLLLFILDIIDRSAYIKTLTNLSFLYKSNTKVVGKVLLLASNVSPKKRPRECNLFLFSFACQGVLSRPLVRGL